MNINKIRPIIILYTFSILSLLQFKSLAQCGNNDVIIQSKENFDFNRDGLKDKATLQVCKSDLTLDLKIFLKKGKSEYSIFKTLNGKIAEGGIYPESLALDAYKDVITLSFKRHTRGTPGGVEYESSKSTYIYQILGKELVELGHTFEDYNEEGEMESFGLAPHEGSSFFFEESLSHNLFKDATLQKKYSDTLKSYSQRFSEEIKTKNFKLLSDYDASQTLLYLDLGFLNKEHVQQLNDIGYFLQCASNNGQAIMLLKTIHQKFPERVVTSLNLADAYYDNGNYDNAKRFYKIYVEQMKKTGKQTKIPSKVWERIK